VTDFARSRLCDQKLAPAASNLALAEWSAPGLPSGDDQHEVPAGGAIIGPHGMPHTFWNPGPAPVRYVIVMSAQTSVLLDALHSGGQFTPEQIRQLFTDHGCELVG
jgi:hypothetical protein